MIRLTGMSIWTELVLWIVGVSFVLALIGNLAIIGIGKLYRRIRRKWRQKRLGIRLAKVPGMKRRAVR